jgi:putative protease
MKRKIELLAPGGDIESIKAAIAAGADAVYCGLDKFNARNRATNISFEDLIGVITLAHGYDCKIFLTLNIIIVGSEIPALVKLLNKLINTGIDGVIIQDLGLFYLLSTYFEGLEIHASTQLNTHNQGQIKFLDKLGADRVNLSRELNINEIKALTLEGDKHKISTEVFVHGSYCISFSGLCYLSSVHGGKSGNRGLCSQPCRDGYLTTPRGKNFPLNLKDNSAFFDLRQISAAGVASIKIEGRIKKSDYVYTVVNSWRKQLDEFYTQNRLVKDNSDLFKVFNRDFSNGYLRGDINKDMFIDHPRDHSIKKFSAVNKDSSNTELLKEKIEYYENKEEIFTRVKNKIAPLSIEKIPLKLSISGKTNTPLRVSVKTPDTLFEVCSKRNLVKRKDESRGMDYSLLFEKLGPLKDSAYYICRQELDGLEKDLFISFKEIASIKKNILSILNDSRKKIPPIEVPFLEKTSPLNSKPGLCVLISSKKDISLCDKTSAKIFFQLPNGLSETPELMDLFLKNPKLIPWFPAVLMGDDYLAGVKFLNLVKPKSLVTNNTGIAYEAYKLGIPWIAGPYLNLVNSFGLLSLKEKFECCGSFISNEINKDQMRRIIHPENFKLYYSIYHPILLLTSRQCLFHQVIGCTKNAVDEDCIQSCSRTSSITNLKNRPLFIEKTKGNFPCIYNHKNFLNTDIIHELPGMFSRFLIDLRDIKTETKLELNKIALMDLFESFINGDPDSKEKLEQMIHPSTKGQYKKGI